MSDFKERLRAKGLRLTPQRELILRAVERMGHATPDEVHAEVQGQAGAINLSTVYRTLEVLEELGLVRHVHLSGRSPTYHAVAEGHTHFHLTCRNCGRVISVDEGVAAGLDARLREEHGFEMDVPHLSVFGVHTQCPSEEESR